ncbi:PREDICTED: gem-associated protein 5 [Cyphomyrmex costatus]|uniref:Gem-associated protein 5 n=1 Tax=Cyphomyrmex costatus TaxID=456900 RepID=A0A151IR38_9HYME|nr:PREDICTED: gem-associated protein 5 [Cyphomyrmex costatus]KYN08591.1 Gem-associated protein 5 [Cyphomyrmex costatus]
MNEVTLPPSPNWYLSNVLACSKRGTVAWGARNFIVIAKPKEDNVMQYSIIKDYFKDKVTALAFCPKLDDPDSPELLICSGDDAKARVWNVDTLELVAEFAFVDGSKLIVGVDWSVKDCNLACAVNLEGSLMYCNIQYKTSKIVSLGKLTATCLACCPHDSSLVAIGTKSGLIYIVQKDTILYRMRGHNEDIVSLSWCPSDMNVLNGGDKRDLLLASGARDRSVFIWRAGRDGRYETVLNIPNMPIMTVPHKSKLNTTNGTWIAVCWAKPNLLLTSSLWGELLSWELSANKEKPKCKLFHTFHNRGLFSIAAALNYDATFDDSKTDSELRVWSLAQDRWVICCKSNNDPTKPAILEYKIPTQGGFVYCMSACPIDTSRIAFGVGDAMLRLWNLSEPHTTTFDIILHWQKIKGKIRVVSWFPEDESTVAFGTGEGRVGVFEAIETNKQPVLYRQYHRNTIYKLEWAQLKSEYFLFSCAEGELIAYKKAAPSDEPISIIKEGCLEFSWKSNICLAVALENGSIMFYDQKLRKRGNSIHILRNVVNCLAWHPESTMADKWMSPIANYLAVASDSCSIMIFDMSKLIKELEATGMKDVIENDQERTMHKIVATLNGHSDKVVCLAWSPHFSGHLVSGSYDNIAQVWNVEKQELMGTYIGHDGPVLCCMWSPLKPQLIMTGSSDFTLHIWNYTLSAQSPKQSSDIKASKKKQKQQKKTTKNKTDDEKNSTALTNLVNQSSIEVTTPKLKVSQSKKKDRKSYFNKYNKLINDKSQILNFIKHDIRNNQTKENSSENASENLSLFCEKKDDFLTFISNEKLTHDNSDIVTELNMWCDDLKNNLICATRDKQLNDFLVSLASSISTKMWRDTCEAYAHQLILQHNPEKAVSYLLAIHKIHEAIDVFVNAKMFKEAYALARCKLDDDDMFLNKILESWAEWATFKGHMEQAAHCYVKLGYFDKAAKVLSHRKDLHCLEVASELAFLNGDEGFGTSLAVDAMTRALMKSEWSKARSLITDIRQVQYLNVHIDAHEIIMSTFLEHTEFDIMKMWLEGKENNGILQILEEKYGTCYYNLLQKKDDTNIILGNVTNDKVVQINVSYQIAMAATCDAKEIRLKYLTTALGNMFEFENKVEYETMMKEGFFTRVLTKLDTKKQTDEDSIYAKSDYPVSQSIRAYLCIGLLNWLLKYLEKLSVEEEIQFTQLVLDLIDDAVNETNLSHQSKISKYNQLEDQLMALAISPAVEIRDKIENGDEYRNTEEEAEKLKLDVNKFIEDRVNIPDPNIVLQKAGFVANKIKDDNNKLQLLQFLDKFVEIKTPQEHSQLENISL